MNGAGGDRQSLTRERSTGHGSNEEGRGEEGGQEGRTEGRRQEDRGEMVRKFQEDEECRVFLAQIQTAGLGITLTAADTAIYYSLSYSFADYDQSRSRIHRIGQKNSCTYIHLVASGSVDEQILKALAEKRNIAATVVDNWRTLIR